MTEPKDIHHLIEETVKRTGQPEAIVELVIRQMFKDVQQFSSTKQGYNIMIPHVGSFAFRVSAIPNYVKKQKSTIGHWVARLIIGQTQNMPLTVNAARKNLFNSMAAIQTVSKIKAEFLDKHCRYKPKTEALLLKDDESDLDRVVEYINILQANIGPEELDKISKEGLQQL